MAPTKKTTTPRPASPTAKASGSTSKKAKTAPVSVDVSETPETPVTPEVPEVPVAETPVVVETPEVPVAVVPATVETLLATITAHFLKAEKEVRAGKALLKKLQQQHNKDIKAVTVALKNGARRRRERDPNAPKRAPSGIAKPSIISPELASFLGVAPETLLARTEVIKHISAYIKANNLENPANRRQIVPNDALSKLLGVTKEDAGDLSYFSIQKQLRPHFPKPVVAVTAVTA